MQNVCMGYYGDPCEGNVLFGIEVEDLKLFGNDSIGTLALFDVIKVDGSDGSPVK